MPTTDYHESPWSSDPRRWERCRQQAAAQMVAQGWPPKAGKFIEVQRRRAMQIWRASFPVARP